MLLLSSLISLNFLFFFFITALVGISAISLFALRNFFLKIEIYFTTFLKKVAVFSFFISFFIFFFTYITFIVWFFFFKKYNFIIFNFFYNINQWNFFFEYFNNLDFFGLTIIFLAYSIGSILLIISDTKIFKNSLSKFLYLNFFILTVAGLVFSTNLMHIFIFYELLLLPSIIYIYIVGYTQRSLQACFYFILWTQLGSLLVLIFLCYVYYAANSFNPIILKNFKFSINETIFLYSLIFFGFGFKIPIWPFHYWLTKTHVEASSGFSIFLSGFLVKTALYGFYKFSAILNLDFNTSAFILITSLGCIDSSIKFFGQTDLKKLVAYCTVQEMNLILLCFCIGDSYLNMAGVFFVITHSFLSALMFFLVDSIYKRYHSRSIVSVTGISHTAPNLGISIFFMMLFFSGIPGTVKFLVEFALYVKLFSISPFLLFILIFFINFVGIIGFSKCWFNALFGAPSQNNLTCLDLTKKEIFIISYCFINLIFFNFLFICII